MARERNINDILGDNVDKFRERVEENVDKFREKVEEAAGKAREHVDEVRGRAEEMADKAKERGEEAWKDAVKYTEKHPAQAIGIALVVGAALGAILFGRRRD